MNTPTLSQSSLVSSLKKLFAILLLLFVSSFVASFLASLLSVLSSNIKFSGIGTMTFDPLITIAYIITYHYSAHFFSIQKNTSFKFFLLTLLLSYTTNFVSGSIFLITLMGLYKKFILKTKEE